MKTEQSITKLTLSLIAILALSLSISVAKGAGKQTIMWNEMAQSQVMNRGELVKLDAVFPTWKIKQTTWPSTSEINTKKVAVDPNLISQCMGWLAKFMKNEQLPTGLDKKLIAMKEWGVIRKEAKQKRLCDVFITRFKKDSLVIHIQESPSNLVIAVSNEELVNKPRGDHKDLVMEIAAIFLNEKLKPQPDSENLHVYEVIEDGQKVTRVLWTLDYVLVTDEKGRKLIDSSKAWEVGTAHIEAETDGRFVKFDVYKCVKGPKKAPDPYKERFSPLREQQDKKNEKSRPHIKPDSPFGPPSEEDDPNGFPST